MKILPLHDNRRSFKRGKVPGVAILESDEIKGVPLVDVGIGGMKVASGNLLSPNNVVSVKLTLLPPDFRLHFSKPTKAKLVHSAFDYLTDSYLLGFKFLEIDETQKDFIASAMESYPMLNSLSDAQDNESAPPLLN